MDSELKNDILALINDEKIFDQIAQEAFNSVDKDNNHTIDKDEFKECSIQVAKVLGLDRPDQETIEGIYKKLDTDGNGDLDFNEFKIYVKDVIFEILEQK